MKVIKTAILLIFIAKLCSCSSSSPFITKELAEELDARRNPFRYVGDFFATIENDVYYFQHIDSIPTRITNSPEETKRDLEVSDDRQKIAYLNETGTPVIIDLEGNEQERLDEFSNVSQFGWTNGDRSLYMLIGNQVFIHGDAFEFKQPEMYTYYDEVLSFSMDNYGNQAYIQYEYRGAIGPNRHALHYFNAGEKTDTVIIVLHNEVDEFHYVDFYRGDGNFVIGYNDRNNILSKVFVHTNHNFYTDYDWEEEEGMTSPIFDIENEMLHIGTAAPNATIKSAYLGTELYFEDDYGIHTRTLDNYSSDVSIYLDF